MRGSKRRISGLAALVVLGSILVPSAAQAAVPSDPQVVVFGNVVPDVPFLGLAGDPGWDDPTFGYDTLFANSLPLGRGERGDAYFYGLADPDVIIDVTVTDGVYELSTFLYTAPAGSSASIDGYVAGQFGVGVPCGRGTFGGHETACDDLNAITVTDLGVHEAETDPAINPLGSASMDPAHWGGSELTFTFQARDPYTNETSSQVSTTLTKYAGTPDDVTTPTGAGGQAFPPEHWCHLSSRGANEPFDGNTLGGTRNGQCSSLAQSPFGAVPDITWLLCLTATSNPHHLIDPSQPGNPLRGFYCEAGGEGAYIPQGEARTQGRVTDAPYGAQHLASEIASATMIVYRGSDVWMGPTDVLLSRAGSSAQWGRTLKINDFEPNWPDGELYRVEVTYADAWGNTRTLASGDITVYPY